MTFSLKKILPHIIVLIGFVVLSMAIFYPLLQGKKLFQSDIVQYSGMAKELQDYRAETGEETYWTNSGFAGMPTYQLGAKYPHNYIKKLDLALRFLPRPADYVFLYLLCSYILFLVLRLDYKYAALGAVAFALSTYLIIILGVGHNSKAHAIAYMPLVLAGIILTFQRKYLWGFALTAIAMGLQLVSNHFQMTYYLLLLVVVLGIAYLVDAYKKKQLMHYFISIDVLVIAVLLAIGMNAGNILATKEYVDESKRGPSELTIQADGSPKEASTGLSKEYITQYSYGKMESFNLFIPRFMGGGNGEELGSDSNTYEAYRKLGATTTQALEEARRAPMYWGDQPIVEAPAYVGAVVIFLAVVALFLVKGRLRWWLVGGVLLSLFLSWGKNMSFLTNFFIDYVPLYNKFRAVSSIQVILELCLPILAVFGLHRLLNDFAKDEEKWHALKWSGIITGGIAIAFLLLKETLFNFSGANDPFYKDAYGPDFIEALRDDRIALYTQDTIRTLVFVALSFGLLWYYLKGKVKEYLVLVGFGVLIIADLAMVNHRYVNADDFVVASRVDRPYQPTPADREIMNDQTHYRVLDVTTGTTRPNYFHNSLSGYNAAELGRYAELFSFHVERNNLEVLNMLNTKYFISDDDNGAIVPFQNPEANGNAWFIQDLRVVENADAEIRALDSLATKIAAVTTDEALQAKRFTVDSVATITLTEVKPNKLSYRSSNANDGYAVFSEIYYPYGWQITIDGEPVKMNRVNYTLRGLAIPKGEHTIVFEFKPEVIEIGGTISLASSILFILLVAGIWFIQSRKAKSADA
ncbi:MAG: YfhO family protein [bacterium]